MGREDEQDGTESINFRYQLNDRLPPVEGILYGLQHLLLMLPVTVLAPVLLGRGLGLSGDVIALLVTSTTLAAGIATILQGFGRLHIGARLPVVQGTELYFIPPLIAIGANAGLGTIAFCVIFGGLYIAVGGRFFRYISQLFPPLVIGTIIALIGVYLIPVGVNQMLGLHTDSFGTYKPLLIGCITFGVTIVCSLLLTGLWNALSVLLGIIAGYIAGVFLGVVNFSPVFHANWFALPELLPFGIAVPNPTTIVMMVVLFTITGVETTGYIASTREVLGEPPSNDSIADGLTADGLGSVISGLLGCTPMTAYAQNLGALGITRVGSRYLSYFAGAIAILLGFVPKFGALVTTIPVPVIGGALALLFGIMSGIGIQTLRPVIGSQRNLVIFGAAMALGVGFAIAPKEAFDFFGPGVAVTLRTGIAVGAVVVVVLNVITPKETASKLTDDENFLQRRSG